MYDRRNISKIALQRICLLVLIACYIAFALHKYRTEQAIDLLTAQFILHEPSSPIRADQIATYVINLDTTPERYAELKPQLEKFNIRHTRFRAVDGYNVKITDDEQKVVYGKNLQSKNFNFVAGRRYNITCPSDNVVYTRYRYLFSAGEFGCYCSHREIWLDVVKRNIKYALILEDDARLLDNFHPLFEETLSHAPADWDIIYLHFTPRESFRKLISIIGNPYIEKISRSNVHIHSFVAYIVSYEGAKKLLENSQEFSLVVDVHSAQLIKSNKIKAYKAAKEFVTTRPKTPENSVLFQMGRDHY